MSRLAPLHRFCLIVSCFIFVWPLPVYAQQAPKTPGKPWDIEASILYQSQETHKNEWADALSTDKRYTLPELISLAEERNPKTRLAWEKAKQLAAKLGIAKSELFPTLAAVAILENNSSALFFETFYTQNLFLFRPAISLSYTVLDFGERRGKIDEQKASLLAANLNFNDVHRQVIYSMVSAYYKVMLAMSRKEAAEVTLANARTVQHSVEERLEQGLATLPDKLDAQAASAKAEYELVAIQGEEDIARGELASLLRESPQKKLSLESLNQTTGFNFLTPDATATIEEALRFRPDFLAKIQRISAAQADIKSKRAAYFPKLTISANYGRLAAYANQEHSPYAFGQIPVYQWQANFNWVLFDGGRRRNELRLAKARYEAALSEQQEAKDQIEFQVWQAYVNLETAKKQLAASERLLLASQKSYEAATESYQYGLRNVIDVTNAQKNLAIARNTFVEARINILVAMAELAFQTGDLVHIGNPPLVNPP